VRRLELVSSSRLSLAGEVDPFTIFMVSASGHGVGVCSLYRIVSRIPCAQTRSLMHTSKHDPRQQVTYETSLLVGQILFSLFPNDLRDSQKTRQVVVLRSHPGHPLPLTCSFFCEVYVVSFETLVLIVTISSTREEGDEVARQQADEEWREVAQ
jgi:hypothetical protein